MEGENVWKLTIKSRECDGKLVLCVRPAGVWV